MLADAGTDLSGAWEELTEEARAELARQGVTGEVSIRRVADARYAGQSHELRITVRDDGADLAELLHAAHEQAYGYAMREERVDVVTLRVVATGPHPRRAAGRLGPGGLGRGALPRHWCGRRDGRGAPAVSRAVLRPGDEVHGPALIEQPDTTTLLARDDRAEVDDAHNLVVHLSC